MMRNNRLWSIVMITGALAGTALSVLLIQEYYGISSGAVRSLCTSSSTGFNSCRTVAESPYAALHGVPFFGAVPLAVIGFLFYGFIAVLGAMNLREKDASKIQERSSIAFLLSVFGLIGDAFLFYISLYVIRALCSLCALTYGATAIILVSSLGPLITGKTDRGFIAEAVSHLTAALRKSIPVYGGIAVAVLALGLAISHGTKLYFDRYESREYADGRVQTLIRYYRDAAPVSIDTTHAPGIGDRSAPVRMVLFIDFTCDHCEKAGKTVRDLMDVHKGKILLHFKHFPLDGPCVPEEGGPVNLSVGPCAAAAAALCAHRQGKYLPVYNALYRHSMKGLPSHRSPCGRSP